MKRRGNREGTIYQRGDQRWEAKVDLGWDGGRRVRKSIYRRTRNEVVEALMRLNSKHQDGLPVATNERLTLGVFLENWLKESVIDSDLKPATREQYQDHIRRYLMPQLGKIRLVKLTPGQVRGMLAALKDKGLSPRTRQISLFVLRRALKQAIQDNLIIRNVASSDFVEGPKLERHPRPRFLTTEQARKFESVLDSHRWGLAYLLGMKRGLRRGELLALHWSDINFDRKTLIVRGSMNRMGGKRFGSKGRLELGSPKTENANRRIPLNDDLVVRLKAHRKQQLEQRLLAGPEWVDHDLVFATARGALVEPRAVTRAIKKALAEAGLPTDNTVHALRHTFGSDGVRRKINPNVMQRLMGHSKVEVTLNLYSHVVDEDLEEAVEEIDRAM